MSGVVSSGSCGNWLCILGTDIESGMFIGVMFMVLSSWRLGNMNIGHGGLLDCGFFLGLTYRCGVKMSERLSCANLCGCLQGQFIQINEKQTSAVEMKIHWLSQNWAAQLLFLNIDLRLQSSEQGVGKQKWCLTVDNGNFETKVTYWEYQCVFTF